MLHSKTLRHILSLTLCAAMVFSLAACGGSSDDDDDGGKLVKKTDDSVVDMGGYEFTIASSFLLDTPVASELTDAETIFEEIRHKVEADYNCKIKILAQENNVEDVRTKILAGDKIADIIDVEGFNTIQLARAGYIVPLETVSGINISDSRWIQGYTELTAFNGQHYGLNFMRPAEARVCMIYNRDLLKKYGITEDPQTLVAEKKWTFDKFREMCKTCTRDTNGDGKTDSYGIYIALPETFGVSMISANGARLVQSENGVAKETFSDPKVLTALNFVYDLVNTDKTANYGGSADTPTTSKESVSRFVAGNSAFYYCETWTINQSLKPIAGDMNYGLLPLPMGPDADDYVSPSENARNFCITSTNKDVDKTVTILNALARYTAEYDEGENWWKYDVQMDYFREDDTTSTDIYMMLIDKATYDLGVGVTDLWKNFKSQVIWDTCFKNKGTPASKIQSVSGKYQSAIDAVYN